MAQDTQGPWAPHYRGFMIIFRPTTFGKTPLEKRSADLKAQKNQKRNQPRY